MSMLPNPDDLPSTEQHHKGITLSPSAIFQYHQSPLPPPEDLAKYEEICPGAAQTIMDSFVQQRQHRMELEKLGIKQKIATQKKKDYLTEKQVDAEITIAKNALSFGCVIIFIMLVLGFIAGCRGDTLLATALLMPSFFKVILDFFNISMKKFAAK
ncbi:MAG: DUF2335 domain-containing protein [Planctomycetia bacterium]|nr:DUF2335 domain-containing protein [Planctomycetia bacterium]